jgi:hypothetical protein
MPVRRGKLWRQSPDARRRVPHDGESLGSEVRPVSDRLHAFLPSLGEMRTSASESSDRVERRLEMLEQRDDELLEALNDLSTEILKITDRLDAAGYDRKLETALETLSGPEADYARLVRSIREVVRDALPRQAEVLVVSKGDDDLLDLYGRPAKHFPQDETGAYAGYNPRSATSAIVQLESLRARGSEFLIFPGTAFWWLDHYAPFRSHLESRYREVVRDEAVCAVYDLRRGMPDDALTQIRATIVEYKERFDRDPAILDWNTGLSIACAFPEHMVFSPPTNEPFLPYVDGSIDLVVVAGNSQAEARRVASGALIVIRTDETIGG